MQRKNLFWSVFQGRKRYSFKVFAPDEIMLTLALPRNYKNVNLLGGTSKFIEILPTLL